MPVALKTHMLLCRKMFEIIFVDTSLGWIRIPHTFLPKIRALYPEGSLSISLSLNSLWYIYVMHCMEGTYFLRDKY